MTHLTPAQLREHLRIEEESALVEQAAMALQRRTSNKYAHQSVTAVLDAFLAMGFTAVQISRGADGVSVVGVGGDIPSYLSGEVA